MSCGLNLNIRSCGIDFFFFFNLHRDGWRGTIKGERRERPREGGEHTETRENESFLTFG